MLTYPTPGESWFLTQQSSNGVIIASGSGQHPLFGTRFHLRTSISIKYIKENNHVIDSEETFQLLLNLCTKSLPFQQMKCHRHRHSIRISFIETKKKNKNKNRINNLILWTKILRENKTLDLLSRRSGPDDPFLGAKSISDAILLKRWVRSLTLILISSLLRPPTPPATPSIDEHDEPKLA